MLSCTSFLCLMKKKMVFLVHTSVDKVDALFDIHASFASVHIPPSIMFLCYREKMVLKLEGALLIPS